MKRILSIMSLFLTFVALTGCIKANENENANEKPQKSPAQIEFETIHRNAEESLKVIENQIKDGMNSDDIMKIIIYTKFPDIHEVTDQEINEMFKNLPESTQKEHNEKWSKDSESNKKRQRILILEKKITEKYGENYFYALDLGTHENVAFTGDKIPINHRMYFLEKSGGGLISIYDYSSKKNAAIVNNYKNKSFRFKFDVTYTVEKSKPEENRLLWEEIDLIFKEIDLSNVN